MNDASFRRRISELARESENIVVTGHAKRRMVERRILLTQVQKALQRGRLIAHAHRDIKGNWKGTLQMTVSGDLIKVAAALGEDELRNKVIVVTVMN